MKMTRSMGICLLFLTFAVAPVFAASGHIVGPTEIVLDGNYSTIENATFEVVVDSSDSKAVLSYEWQFGVSGSGVGFNTAASQTKSEALITAGSHSPRYFCFGDSGGLQAVASEKGIRCSDVLASLTPSDPSGKSLGYFQIDINAEYLALGQHTISDPDSFFFLSDLSTTETLSIEPFTFTVTPEPASMVLLGLGGLALLRRRRK